MNETVLDFCKTNGIELTRSRAYKKNDQAWVEQKNGAIVRRLVGYGRLSGMAATGALARLYAVSRLYINYFQPSFKLKSKQRDGARVIKHYHSPMTPCERLLGSPSVEEAIKERLRAQLDQLDLVRKEIREAQQELAGFAARGAAPVDQPPPQDVKMFLDGLADAWKAGAVRATHRRKSTAQRSWPTRCGVHHKATVVGAVEVRTPPPGAEGTRQWSRQADCGCASCLAVEPRSSRSSFKRM